MFDVFGNDAYPQKEDENGDVGGDDGGDSV